MRFDSIAGSIGEARAKTAQQRWQQITLELGTREDNYHVGSGIGGNNAQLFALLTYRHRLTDSDKLTIDPNDGWCRWGEKWLMGNGKKVLRQELDTILPIPKSTPVDAVRNGMAFPLGQNTANLDILLYACKLCAGLSAELDKGDTTNIRATAMALSGFSYEVILYSVRRYIQIERLVKFNLDEQPDWAKILGRINKSVDN